MPRFRKTIRFEPEALHIGGCLYASIFVLALLAALFALFLPLVTGGRP